MPAENRPTLPYACVLEHYKTWLKIIKFVQIPRCWSLGRVGGRGRPGRGLSHALTLDKCKGIRKCVMCVCVGGGGLEQVHRLQLCILGHQGLFLWNRVFLLSGRVHGFLMNTLCMETNTEI